MRQRSTNPNAAQDAFTSDKFGLSNQQNSSERPERGREGR